jgi:glycosyltransferase involved in cell wall biosynthesis
MPHSLADSAGPFVYAGSLQDWKGLELAVAAAEKLDLPLRIIGGTKKEIAAAARRMQRVTRLRLSPLRRTHVVRHIEWRERVAPDQLPEHLLGCRAGLNPTLPHSASGHYSLPMKLYDYARCGLPAISSALDSLQGLGVESWCQVVEKPTVDSWSLALMQPIGVEQGRAALKWAAQNSWRKRAQALDAIISGL